MNPWHPNPAHRAAGRIFWLGWLVGFMLRAADELAGIGLLIVAGWLLFR